MKSIIRNLVLGLVVSAGIGVSVPSNAAAEEVYMIRGFMNVFSNGMNQMTKQLKAGGIKARAISNGDWRNVANDIIKRAKKKQVSYPIVIAGHSLGGVEAPRFANALGAAGVPVALVIGLDPGFAAPPPFRKGAVRVVNYKIPSGQNYRKGPGFKGKIITVDVSKYGTDHVGIDKNKKVQSLVISQIKRTVR
ncbi:MAG: hypothetical protein AAF478_01195 [Pseudomonadota bacterium]